MQAPTIPRNSAKSDSRIIHQVGEGREAVAVELFLGGERRSARAYREWKRGLRSSECLQMRKVYSAEGLCKLS